MKATKHPRAGRDTAGFLLTWLAALAAVLVAVTLPAGYFLAEYNRAVGKLESEAEVDAFLISRQVNANPALWQFEVNRLQDLLERNGALRASEYRRVLDRDGQLVADTVGRVELPVVTRSHAVQDAGIDVGLVEVSRSLRSLLYRTFLVFLLGLGLGSLLFYILRVAPIRAVLAAEERFRKANAELLASNAELQAFMYSAAHDMRGPLVNLSGFARELGKAFQEASDLMAAKREGLTTAEAEHLATILRDDGAVALGFLQSAVGRMDMLVNGLLKLSQATQQRLQIGRLDPAETVAAVLRSCQTEIKEREVRVQVGVLPTVDADPEVLALIFTHLLDNALKYLQPGRPGRIEIAGELADGAAVFRVRDNGRGIAEADMDKLFLMFRRLGDNAESGVGIGLAQVRTLLRRHGGDIRCESTYGEGSVFIFTLPEQQVARKIS